jgi:subtilisin family serine protease
MEKEYTVIANTREDLPALETEITASSGAGPIPNRSVDIANPRPGSKIQTHFMLTDEEAEELRADVRVRAVEIPPEQRDDVSIGLNATQSGQFYRGSGLNTEYVNWGLRRCIDEANPYLNAGNRVADISTANPPVNEDYQYGIDGTGVDVVIQDSGIDPDHPDWLSTKNDLIDTVQGGVATFNFIDSNIATNDIYVPYYQFANPTANYIASMTGTPWANGQYDGAEFLIRFVLADGLTVERTRIFGGIGNGTVTAGKNTFELSLAGTIHIEQTDEDLRLAFTTGGYSQNGVIQLWLKSGQSRLRQIDWYGASGLSGTQSADHYRDLDGHGSHCASIAAGLIYGWAKGAHIYSQKLSGLETLAGSDGTGIAISDAFDTIRLWHNAKTTGRPTVVNMSWGYGANITGNPASGTYRGTAWTWGVDYNNRTTLMEQTGVSENFFSGGTSFRMPNRLASVDAEVDDMIADGIHVCIAAGNNLHKADLSTGPDYNNEVVFGAQTRTYHRGSSPFSDDAFMVGNVDSGAQDSSGSTDNSIALDQTSVSTTRGPGVTIFAPGTDIMAATSTQYDTGSYSTTTYPGDNAYPIMSIGGTSMASPQVAGVVAQHLQVYPNLTPAKMKTRIYNDSKAVMFTTGSDTDYRRIHDSLMGAPNRMLYSRYGKQAFATNTTIIQNVQLT